MKDPDDLTDRYTDNKPKQPIVQIGMGTNSGHSRVLLATALAMLGGKRTMVIDDHMGFREDAFNRMKEEAENKKSDFTKEEEEILKTLHGKEKKKYVKQLKEKYKC